MFEHLRKIFTDQEEAERVVQSIFFLFLDPPKCAWFQNSFWIMKENQKKSKDPFYTQNWKNPKNVFLKAEGVVKSIFSFSLIPQMCLFWFVKSFRFLKILKDPFYTKIGKIQKMSF